MDIQEEKQYNLYNSHFSKASFHFGGVKVDRDKYRIRFEVSDEYDSFTDLDFDVEQIKFNYEDLKYYIKSYPFEFLKRYYVRLEGLNPNTLQNMNYSGGVFDLFNSDSLSRQNFCYLIIEWYKFIGKNYSSYQSLDLDIYEELFDLVEVERSKSINDFIQIEIRVIDELLKETKNEFISEILNSNNQSNYLNKVVEFVLNDYKCFRGL